MGKAAKLGLQLQGEIEVDQEDIAASHIPDSRREFVHGVYAAFSPPYYRPIGAAPYDSEQGRVHTINETIDKSVFERLNRDSSYRPKNLAEWAKRSGFKLGGAPKSVLAHQPDPPLDD